ncbi:Phophatidylserine decarboxylase-domain-containing protein [Boletus edulis]|uniref:Phosphatidylserine decarboxylase proenzyme-like protein n=1 Tax=Boletus edulis BED1 TaxID=1328754 RepID=A0AAD4G6D2_BOLED|nr:Phophatidylserine decarboxylase-domain-containing protein [Boletus edulis]KAF8421150.1 phosphatidylserine decarboxylase proenzyme-like protein [Boletus edulis BED1]KAF8452408.1 phosphatidylserine decarboxylase proenzyme-like protein [Boletus edulis BED1]
MPFRIEYRGTIARWLPKDPAVIWKYESDLLAQLITNGVCTRAGVVDEKQFSLVTLEFKKLIEENAEIFRDFHEMFDQVLPNPDADQLIITNYMQLLAVLDRVITVAPTYNYTSPLVSGVPMYGILAPFCNTEAGYRAFTHPKVNAMFHKIFDEWTRFLVSPASRDVLVSTAGGWFSPEALQVQTTRLGMPFEQAWVCYPNQPNMGFTSWDDFFVRRFREGVRPTVAPDNAEFINVACEAITYRVAADVQATDEFWLKDMPYSLEHVLNYDLLASQLVGGTVFQAMLSSMDYHRWHSPIDGRVVKAYIVPGTYYAARLDDDSDMDVISRSQAFVTAISTRALIFIESDNPNIGLMCFVGVGLGEISTTKLEVREGDRIKKGDEIGSFHFGGSTHLLVFRPQTKLTLLPGPEDPEEARKVGTLLFHVDNDPLTT